MKATIKLAGGSRLIEVEGVSQKDLFEEMAKAHEVFGEATCGLCGSTNIRPVVRVVDKFRFYEYSCQEPGCWAKLSFGQAQEGDGLFPKRKLLPNGKPDKDGEFGPHKGWTKYRGEGHEEPPKSVPQGHDEWSSESIPPAPPLTILRQILGDMQVFDSEPKMQDAVIRFITQGQNGPEFGFSECANSSEKSEKAVRKLRGAIAHYKGGAELLVKVQEWIGSKKP